MSHKWLSVFSHRKMDPYTSQWRSNVLLQSLLLILMINGLFYATDDGEDDSIGAMMFVSLLSALVVATMAATVAKLAKRVGYLQWEIRLCRIRDQLCRPTSKSSSSKDPKASTNDGHERSHSRTRMLGEGDDDKAVGNIGAAGSAEDATKLAERLRKLRTYQLLAWSLFLTTTIGSAFIVLVLGLKFDLEDEARRDAGIEVHRSRSFKWLLSVIFTELIETLFLSPASMMGQTFALFFLAEFAAPFVIDLFIDSDSVKAIKAFDVFTRAVRGHELKPYAFDMLKLMIANARKRVYSVIDSEKDSKFCSANAAVLEQEEATLSR